jgi:putative RNA 2'-phosphotransferase|nr:RNA 2'-phosphotransferase [Neorhizobium tomejilense]
MEEERQVVISKTLSRILRHNPSSAVKIDGSGYTDLAGLIVYMKSVRPFSQTGIETEEIFETVQNDPKRRFQINGASIRAMSGHSFPVDTGGEAFYPSGPLYFGTTEQSRRVLTEGLTLSKKLKVRLSYSYQEALGVAVARSGDNPLVIEVDAERLANDGWAFEMLSNGEVLTDPIGPDYLSEARDPKVVPMPRFR